MRRLASILFLAVSCISMSACGGPDPETGRTKVADKWLSRATQSYRVGDLEDAAVAIDGALKAAPKDPQAHIVAARIALARLDFPTVIRETEGIPETEAKALRGRAFWYSGDIERAADDLEEMLRDPAVKDPWARDVAKLARRGHGRKPFAIEGGVVASVEMPQTGPALVVPCELEGERILALVATNYGELMLDSATRKEPAWVNLRFAERIEVKDVPALTTDLSSVSRALGGMPIKALLGVNVLRRMHVTFDRHGSQFVVRKGEAPAPPDATRMPIFYARGGAMMLRASVSNTQEGQALLFIDSSALYPMALEDALFKRAGADLSKFQSQPGAPPSWKIGPLPFFKLGPVDLSSFPAVHGPTVAEYKQTFDVDLSGIIGAGLLSIFRVTFGDDGRSVWLELDPTVMAGGAAAVEGPPPSVLPPSTLPSTAPPGTKPAPPSSAKPDAKPPTSKPEPKAEQPKEPPPGAKSAPPKSESKGAAR